MAHKLQGNVGSGLRWRVLKTTTSGVPMTDWRKLQQGCLNDPTWQADPERALVEAMLRERIEDAMGRSAYSQETCPECHFDVLGCGCHTIRLDCKPKGKPTKGDNIYAQVSGKMRLVPVARVGLFEDGHWYCRYIKPVCGGAPTYQACAMAWFGLCGSPAVAECASTCDSLGIELSCLQQMILRGGK